MGRRLLTEIDTSAGIRLLDVGATARADFVRDELFGRPGDDEATVAPALSAPVGEELASAGWQPGQDVRYDERGTG